MRVGGSRSFRSIRARTTAAPKAPVQRITANVVSSLAIKVPVRKLEIRSPVRAEDRYCSSDGSHTTPVSRPAASVERPNRRIFSFLRFFSQQKNSHAPAARIRKITTM